MNSHAFQSVASWQKNQIPAGTAENIHQFIGGKMDRHQKKSPDGTTEIFSKGNIFAETAEAVIVFLVILMKPQ